MRTNGIRCPDRIVVLQISRVGCTCVASGVSPLQKHISRRGIVRHLDNVLMSSSIPVELIRGQACRRNIRPSGMRGILGGSIERIADIFERIRVKASFGGILSVWTHKELKESFVMCSELHIDFKLLSWFIRSLGIPSKRISFAVRGVIIVKDLTSRSLCDSTGRSSNTRT